ncbi:MAG: MCE family protein [Deltaproteobacteria bacterium]|nr:MCE family protein [Deltaproteobacteria bacterium]
MLTKASSFRVGLFLLSGIGIGLAAVIWLGTSQLFEKTMTYATYFDESVSGLSVDSSVKYRGVDVGRVKSIEVAPDGRLIEVLIQIDSMIRITSDVRAQLKEAGITGIRYIELARIETPEAEKYTLNLPFPTPAPVIPSRPSALGQLFKDIDKVFTRFSELDLESLVIGIKDVVNNANDLLSNPDLQDVIAKLRSMATDLATTAAELKALSQNPHLSGTLENADALLAQARSLTLEFEKSVDALNLETRLGRLMDKLDTMSDAGARLLTGLDQKSRLLERKLDRIAGEMDSMFQNLNEFSERLKDRPSELLFSDPPPERRW